MTVTAFMRRLGITYASLRSMIKRGLRVRVDGRYRRVRSDDYDAYLASLPCVDPDDYVDPKPVEAAAKESAATATQPDGQPRRRGRPRKNPDTQPRPTGGDIDHTGRPSAPSRGEAGL